MKVGIKNLTFCSQDLYWDPVVFLSVAEASTLTFTPSFMNLVFPFRLVLYLKNVMLQQYMNRELPDVQTGFRKGRGTRDQISNIRWIM